MERQLERILGKKKLKSVRSTTCCQRESHRSFEHTRAMIEYDADLYMFFLHIKHMLCYIRRVCWYRKGIVYSGIRFVFASSCTNAYNSNTSICENNVYSFNVWDYTTDICRTVYFKLYSAGIRAFRFYSYDRGYTENYSVLGSEAIDSRFEYAFHTAICDEKKDDMDVIQDVLYHTGVLVTLYIVQLT